MTDDCDAAFEHIEATGAEVMQEPVDRPGGTRDCAFLDPSGNTLRFTQPPPAAQSAPPVALRGGEGPCDPTWRAAPS
ncbi:VOC family protein [Actinomadura namibiensis]|uniref:VOC family protein n=1 Tax=Actinomadura kijaniata TaxID=46161 RepID=UPI003619F95E